MPKNGGRRPGAGRPKGSKTKKTSDIALAAAGEGITPLEYMINIVRDEKAEPARRDDMAKAVAPYMHPRLSSVEANVKGEQTIKIVSTESMPENDWETEYSDHLATPARPPESLN